MMHCLAAMLKDILLTFNAADSTKPNETYPSATQEVKVLQLAQDLYGGFPKGQHAIGVCIRILGRDCRPFLFALLVTSSKA